MSVQENSLWFLQKAKAIQTDVGILMHILTYSDIFKHRQTYSQAYSEPSLRTLLYSVPEAYSEPWYIQHPDLLEL